MNKKKIVLSALFAFITSGAIAQQNDTISLKEVVVSDTKFSLSKEKSGKIIEKITAKDLEKKMGQSVASILSQVAGIEVNGNQSANGKNLGLYIRGGRNRQVLILIDGVPVTDASGINLEYDLRLLPVEQIESIEILKGASSTLYGSNAATGVINITLKNSSDKKIAGNAYINLGTQNTADNFETKARDFNQGFSINGTLKKVSYLTAVNSTETKGISQTKGVNFEDDAFSRININSKVSYKPTKNLNLDLFANYDRLKNDYDQFFDNFNNPDTDLNVTVSEQFRVGIASKYKYRKGEFVLNSGYSNINRNFQELNSWTSSIDNSTFESRNISIDAFNKYTFNKNIFIIAGTQVQFQDMFSSTPFSNIRSENSKFSQIDPYASMIYNSNFGFNLNIGARLNSHSNYGSNLVFNVNPSYNFKSIPLKIITSYSTAFITPSLFQLYSSYGNLELNPEKNATAELGFEALLLEKKLILNTVGFYRNEENAIVFFTHPITFASNYINTTNKTNARGIETSLTYNLSNNIKLNGNYTFTQVEENTNALIPKHKFNLFSSYSFKKGAVNLSYQYVDDRNESYFDGATFSVVKTKLQSYQLINLSSNYNLIKDRLNIWCSVNNLLNQDYLENIGYNTRGRNVKLGLNILF